MEREDEEEGIDTDSLFGIPYTITYKREWHTCTITSLKHNG